MKTLRIQSRLVALAGAGALMACLIGSVGYLGLERAIRDSHLLEDSAVAVHASMNADMKHDNIRAEIFRMAIASGAQDTAQMAAVEQAVATEVKTLQTSLATAAQRAPTADAQAAARRAMAPAQDFAAAALKAVATMKAGPQGNAGALAEFDTAFKALESVLEQSGDAIERASEQLADGAHASSSQAKQWMLAVFVGGLAALMVFSGWVIRSVLTPMRAIRDALDQLNQGDGDLARRLPAAAAEFGDMSERFNAFLGKIAGVVGEVQGAAREVSVASQQIALGNQDLSQRTEQSAGSLQQAVAQVADIGAQVQQGADAARQASGLASHASAVAARGGAAVHRVVSTMDEINLASRRIGDIIGVIDGIAFQTNILALNAAVEAARAGEQGRGFAVVASEVRTLAGRSAEAAREIKALVGTSVAKVDAGGQYVRDAGTTMDEIVASVDRLQAIIEAIAGAADAQRAGIGQVNRTVVALDQNTQQNAALVEQTAAAAQQVARQTRVLCETVSVFRTER